MLKVGQNWGKITNYPPNAQQRFAPLGLCTNIRIKFLIINNFSFLLQVVEVDLVHGILQKYFFPQCLGQPKERRHFATKSVFKFSGGHLGTLLRFKAR